MIRSTKRLNSQTIKQHEYLATCVYISLSMANYQAGETIVGAKTDVANFFWGSHRQKWWTKSERKQNTTIDNLLICLWHCHGFSDLIKSQMHHDKCDSGIYHVSSLNCVPCAFEKLKRSNHSKKETISFIRAFSEFYNEKKLKNDPAKLFKHIIGSLAGHKKEVFNAENLSKFNFVVEQKCSVSQKQILQLICTI